MKDFFIADAARFENQVVTTFFALTGLNVRERKGGGGQYLALLLSDRTGQMEARMWEEFAPALDTCAEGCFVKVQGQVSRYQGRFQITLTRMRAAREDEIEAADFVPASRFDIDEMDAELRTYVAGLRDPWLQRLLLAFLDDAEIGPAFRKAPAAKRLHHAWLGGLLEHVLHLVRVCRAVVPLYPEVDPDLLVTGAILHDIGKVRELSWTAGFAYTLEGQLVGHISIGQRLLGEKIAQLNREGGADDPRERFPEPLRLLLEHMLLAHHGKLEFGSPKLPMTPEALLLSALDDLEAKFQTLRGEFAQAEQAGRAADQPTEWVRSMERNLFDSGRYRATQDDAARAERGRAVEPENPVAAEPDADAPVDAQLLAEEPSFTLRMPP